MPVFEQIENTHLTLNYVASWAICGFSNPNKIVQNRKKNIQKLRIYYRIASIISRFMTIKVLTLSGLFS